jgi:hypothetical protein
MKYSGDSYSAVGYNVTEDYPSFANPIGNPAYPGDTTSFGANWVISLDIEVILG